MKDNLGKREAARPNFGGDIHAFSLFEMCQFLMVVRRTGKLTVKSGKRTATLGIENGQIVSVVDDKLETGEEAFYRVVSWARGRFEFTPGPVTGTGLGVSTDALLLEAARRLDEGELASEADEPSAANRVQNLLAGQFLMEDVAGLRPTVSGSSDIDFHKHFTLEALIDAVRRRGADSVILGADRPARIRVGGCLVDLNGELVPRRVVDRLLREIWADVRPSGETDATERTIETGDVIRAMLGSAGDVLRLDLLAANPPPASEFGAEGAEFFMALGLADAGLFVVGASSPAGRSAFFARLAYEFAEVGQYVLWAAEMRRHAPRPHQGWIETADLLSADVRSLRRRLLDDRVDVVLLDPIRGRGWSPRAVQVAGRGAVVVLGVQAEDLEETMAQSFRFLQPRDEAALDALAACARGAVHLAENDEGASCAWNAELKALTEGVVRSHYRGKPERRQVA